MNPLPADTKPVPVETVAGARKQDEQNKPLAWMHPNPTGTGSAPVVTEAFLKRAPEYRNEYTIPLYAAPHPVVAAEAPSLRDALSLLLQRAERQFPDPEDSPQIALARAALLAHSLTSVQAIDTSTGSVENTGGNRHGTSPADGKEPIQYSDELRPSSDLAREAKRNVFKMRGGWNQQAADAAIAAIDALDRAASVQGKGENPSVALPDGSKHG